MDLHNLCTFVIPLRIDSEERLRNLRFLLEWLSPLNANIILLEADKETKIDDLHFNKNIRYIFEKDENNLFHRTRYINKLIINAETEIVSVVDTDIIVGYSQIKEAVQSILDKGNTLVYPYDSRFISLSKEDTEYFIKTKNIIALNRRELPSLLNRPLCGGIYMIHKKRYLTFGGENEHFIGWGPEDAERLRRVLIMGGKVDWIKTGCAYHLFHPRNENSRFYNENTVADLKREFVKVCCMDRTELAEYIQAFPWLEQFNK